MNYKAYKKWAYHELAQFRIVHPEHSGYRFHGNRHDFAHEQYEKAWIEHHGVSIKAPVISGNYGKDHIQEICKKTGLSMARAQIAYKEINLTIAESLGHHRDELDPQCRPTQ